MKNNKKVIILIISVLVFIVMTGGISYSYFVYDANVVTVDIDFGKISMDFTSNNDSLSLSNEIPLSDNLGKIQDVYLDFNVNGTLDTESIYYEIQIVPDSENTLDSEYVKVYLTDQNDNYIAGPVILDDLPASKTNDGKKIFEYIIDPSGVGSVKSYQKAFRLRVWIDENYSDITSKTFEFSVYLYAENTDITASGLIKRNVNIATINFGNNSSSTNGEGLYILPGTANDTNPIYYYRGAVNNNNVVFAGYCWQMVRTTDTGGIKMIYNGLPDIAGSGDNITYNCGTSRDIQDTKRTTIDLKQSSGYYYADDYEIVSTTGNSVTYRLKAGSNGIHQFAIADATAAATTIPTIVANYPYTCKQTTDTGTCTTLYKVDSYASGTNARVYSTEYRTIVGYSDFNSQYNSVSDIGYMSNTRYSHTTLNWTTNALFGSDAIWNGTSYELTDASVTTPNATHHYSCNATTSDATCTNVRYVYVVNAASKFYITLRNGEKIEDALYKMTGNGDATIKARNANYVLNQNNSNLKAAVDNWFRTNLTNEVDVNKTDYQTYLEDTVFCDDRSFKTTGSNNKYEQSGWNSNGGNLSTYLYFGTYNRLKNSWYSESNVPAIKNTGVVPNLACPNESDRFTVSNTNGNGALTYPVGLLTVDEIIMAGAGGNSSTSNNTYYLYTDINYWSLSPSNYYVDCPLGFTVVSGAINSDFNKSHITYSRGLRPVVSLKRGIRFEENGDGTGTNPYVVKYD